LEVEEGATAEQADLCKARQHNKQKKETAQAAYTGLIRGKGATLVSNTVIVKLPHHRKTNKRKVTNQRAEPTV
jgi:hypothetical protein